MRFRRLCFVSA